MFEQSAMNQQDSSTHLPRPGSPHTLLSMNNSSERSHTWLPRSPDASSTICTKHIPLKYHVTSPFYQLPCWVDNIVSCNTNRTRRVLSWNPISLQEDQDGSGKAHTTGEVRGLDDAFRSPPFDYDLNVLFGPDDQVRVIVRTMKVAVASIVSPHLL